jgi:hypothetical protein
MLKRIFNTIILIFIIGSILILSFMFTCVLLFNFIAISVFNTII